MFATPPMWGVVFFYTILMPLLMIAIFVLWLVGALLSGRMAYVFTAEPDLWKRRRKIFIAMLLSWALVLVALVRFYLTTKQYDR
jgi:hypothetical protein